MTTGSHIRTSGYFARGVQVLLAIGLLSSLATPIRGKDQNTLKPLMVEKGKLVYQNTFEKSGPPDKRWRASQGTRWEIVDGVLLGIPATEERQKEKVEKGLVGFKTGTTPKIWFHDAPKDFVSSLRIRFTGGGPPTKLHPHIEWGHHLLRVYFGEKSLKVLSNSEKNLLGECHPGFKRDHWYHILMERKGHRMTVQIGSDYKQSGDLKLYMGTEERPRFKKFAAGEPDGIGLAGSENGHVSIDDFYLWEAGGLTAYQQVDLKNIPVVDSHIHFFDTSRPEGVMWPPKSNKALYRPFFPKDFKPVAKDNNVLKAVVVQASNWVKDMEWILNITEKESGYYPGVVCNLSTLGTKQFKIDIDKVINNKRLVGMRITHPPENRPFYTEQLLKDLKYIARHNMSLDIRYTRFENHDVINIAKEIPELNIMVGFSGENTELIREMGKRPNVYCKYTVPMHVADYQGKFDLIWENFGPERIVFGSNWPAAGSQGYADKKEALFNLVKGKGKDAVEKVFYKNTVKFYQLENGRR